MGLALHLPSVADSVIYPLYGLSGLMKGEVGIFGQMFVVLPVCQRVQRITLIVLTLILFRHTRNTYGDRCFAAAGPWVWNSLSAEL